MSRTAICFAAPDAVFAQETAHYLGLHTSLRPELAQTDQAEDFLDLIEQCLGYEFVIVMISAASVPRLWPRQQWERVLVECVKESECQVAYLVREACAFPQTLRRTRCFETLGPLRQWAIHELHPERFPPVLSEASEEDLRLLDLVERPGVISEVTRECAEWLVKTCWRDFENVYRVTCGSSARASVLGEMAVAMNLRLAGTVDQNWRALQKHAEGERALYLFDNLPDGFCLPGGKASVVVMARQKSPDPLSLDELKQLFFARGSDESACLRALGLFMQGNGDSSNWEALKAVGFRALLYLKRQARLAEAHELLTWLTPHAKRCRDIPAWNQMRWEEDWILDAWDLPPGERSVLMKTQASQMLLPV